MFCNHRPGLPLRDLPFDCRKSLSCFEVLQFPEGFCCDNLYPDDTVGKGFCDECIIVIQKEAGVTRTFKAGLQMRGKGLTDTVQHRFRIKTEICKVVGDGQNIKFAGAVTCKVENRPSVGVIQGGNLLPGVIGKVSNLGDQNLPRTFQGGPIRPRTG